MKALIVDDEKHVRDAVKILIDWQHHGITEIFEAPEGLSAIKIIEKERPEIVFTDMVMPIKDGSELLAWIHQHHPHSKTIVISGHDDFSFMRHAIKYGGMDYILKPIDEAELNEALLKAIQSWQHEASIRHQQQHKNIQMNQIKPIYWDSIFSNMIKEPHIYPSIAKELEADFGMSSHIETIQVAVLCTNIIPPFIKKKYSANQDLLFYTLANICNEFLMKEKIGYAFRHANKDHELVIITWANIEHFISYLRQINEGIYRTLGSHFDFGIGALKPFYIGITESYEQAQNALNQRNLLQKQTNIHVHSEMASPRMNGLHFTDVEAKIRLTLLSQHAGQIATAIEEWFQDIRKLEVITVTQLELCWHEFTVFHTRCLNEFLKDLPSESESDPKNLHLNIPLDEHGQFSLTLWQAEFVQILQDLSSFLATQQQKETNVIFEIAAYIQQHYAEEMTLQHISERYFLSREYISRKFKQELNENLSDYISRIRIDKAKLLLVNPQLRIAQISEMIGYQDEKYFSKVFKKLTGLSPSQFRKKQG